LNDPVTSVERVTKTRKQKQNYTAHILNPFLERCHVVECKQVLVRTGCFHFFIMPTAN